MDAFQPFAIAILIGLLVGMEREKAHGAAGTMGVRTFTLIALLGAISGWVGQMWIGILAATFALVLIVISYIVSNRGPEAFHYPGVTTEVAAGVVFCLGFGAHQAPVIAALLGPIVALILISKENLHEFTYRVRPSELQAVIVLLLIGVVVSNLIEDRTIDPWGLFNPRKFGFLVLILALLEFTSYIAMKFMGEKRSLMIVGFLGGLVSSTAVLFSTGKEAQRRPEAWRQHAATILLAKSASLLEVLLFVGIISFPLLTLLAPAILSACLLGAFLVVWLTRGPIGDSTELNLPSPLDLRGILRLALLLGAILIAVGAVQIWLGDQGTQVLAFIAGLFELQGVSIAASTLNAQNQLSALPAAISIATAAFASMFSKSIMIWYFDRGKTAGLVSVSLLAMCALLVTIMYYQVQS
jgi:uncharacterized membrane protein (DUF4010 family)